MIMESGTNAAERFDELEQKRTKRQFQIRNDASKKIVNLHQENEYTRINKHSEGLCFLCEEYKAVIATMIDSCYRCAEKRNQNSIMAVSSRQAYGYCLVHAGFPKFEYRFNIAQLNVRVCNPCYRKIAMSNKKVRTEGLHKIDPFWTKMRKQMGKTYLMEFFPREFSRRDYRK